MSRRSPRAGRNWGQRGDVPAYISIEYTCARNRHAPQVWTIRRDNETRDLWFTPRPDGLTAEPVDFAQHPRLIFLCPTCGNEVVYTLSTVHRHFDETAARGRRVDRRDL